jgi:excisionase family DNA binding protein
MDENLYRLDVAAKRLDVHTETIKRWASSGKAALIELPGGHLRIAESEIVRLMGLRSHRNLQAETQPTPGPAQ